MSTSRKEPLYAAIIAALVASGCCHTVERTVCIPAEEPVCPSRDDAADLIAADEVKSDGVYFAERTYKDGGETITRPAECCYETESVRCEEMNGFGRPYYRGSCPVIARPVRRKRSGQRRLRWEGKGPVRRRELAALWVRRGALEHAAVASFGRFALDLLALGAPDDLVQDAIRAIREEARHAKLAFAVAASLGDRGHEPGRLPIDVSLNTTCEEFVRRTVVEGCVAETIGTDLLKARAEATVSRSLRRILKRLAKDETRHADLGFRALEFALRFGGEAARKAAETAFTEALGAQWAALDGAPGEDIVADVMLGEITLGTRREITRKAIQERVLPAARALGLEVACA